MFGLTACAPSQRGDLPADWIARSDALGELSFWSLNGRIGLQLDNRGFNGALTWQQSGEKMRADFRGPFGAGAFRVSGAPGNLVLETGAGETYLLDDSESVLAEELGWSIPLEPMRYWLIGMPHPVFPAQQSFGPDGRLTAIEQLGWRINYERYRVAEGWEMPRKLVLRNDVNVRIKLVISRWSLANKNCPPDCIE